MVLIIIAITTIVSIMAFYNYELFYRFQFTPYLVVSSKQWYRFFTYALLHAGWGHLFINMFVLYSFGDVVLQAYIMLFGVKGYYYFILLYVASVMFSVLPTFGKHKNNPNYNAVGASGAVSAVVFASILFVPTGKIMVFPIPFGIPAFIFGVLYLIYSAVMAKRAKDNIGHDAHFWGAVFGIVFTLVLKPKIFIFFINEIKDFFGIW